MKERRALNMVFGLFESKTMEVTLHNFFRLFNYMNDTSDLISSGFDSNRCYGYIKGHHIRLNRNEMSFWTKF